MYCVGLVASVGTEERLTVSILAEVNDIQGFYKNYLKQLSKIPARVHLIMISENLSTSLTAEEQLPNVDIIGKPIRMSVLHQCLLNNNKIFLSLSAIRASSSDVLSLPEQSQSNNIASNNSESGLTAHHPSPSHSHPIMGLVGSSSTVSNSGPDIPQTTAPTPATSSSSITTKVRILIAEDNSVNQKVVVAFLKKISQLIEWEIAGNGEEAVRLYQEKALILSSWTMPIMDGYTATSEIRKIEQNSGAHVTIVALTANAMEEDRQRCLRVGMDDYMAKPIRLDTLRLKLSSFFPQLAIV